MTAEQRFPQGGFIHQRAAPGIDQQNTGLHLGKGFPVDQVLVLLCQRAMERNNVASLQQFFHENTPFPARRRGVQHIHAESTGDSAHGFPDAAITDQPHGFAAQLDLRVIPEAELPAAGPAPLLYGLIMRAHPMAKLQQERKGVLGDRVGGIRRNVAYGNVPFCRRDGIDHIKTGGQNANHSQVRMAFDHFPGDNGFVGQHNFSVRHTV